MKRRYAPCFTYWFETGGRMNVHWWEGYMTCLAEQVHNGAKPAAVLSMETVQDPELRERLYRALARIAAVYDLDVVPRQGELWLVREEDEATHAAVETVPPPTAGPEAHRIRGRLCGYSEEAIEGYIAWRPRGGGRRSRNEAAEEVSWP